MTQLRRLLGPLAALFVALGMPALAQDNPFAPSGTGSVSISASNVSANVALPANTPVALVCNAGTVNVFFKAGVGNTTTATASNFILLPGLCQTLNVAAQTYIAAITSSGTTTVWITQGRGNPDASPGALGSSGISLSGTGANNADTVASVATGLSSADTYNFLYNGTTWDRARGDTTNGAWVNVKASALPSNAAQETGGNLATIATQNTAINTLLGLQADAACATDNGTCTLEALVKRLNQRTTTINTTLGTPFQAGGSIGNTTFAATQSGTWTVQPGNTANTTPWLVTDTPSSASGAALTKSATQSAASNAVVKSGAGNLYGLTVTVGATAGWVMVFDATSLPSNGATGSSMIWCYPINSDGTKGGIDKEFNKPISFTTGLTLGFSSTACNSLTASATAFFYGRVL